MGVSGTLLLAASSVIQCTVNWYNERVDERMDEMEDRILDLEERRQADFRELSDELHQLDKRLMATGAEEPTDNPPRPDQ